MSFVYFSVLLKSLSVGHQLAWFSIGLHQGSGHIFVLAACTLLNPCPEPALTTGLEKVKWLQDKSRLKAGLACLHLSLSVGQSHTQRAAHPRARRWAVEPPKFRGRWGVEELAVPRGALLALQGAGGSTADPSTPELLLELGVGRSGARPRL